MSLLLQRAVQLGFGFVIPGQAYAHGFGERYDLPVPLWLYVGGAGATVALSFVVIGLSCVHAQIERLSASKSAAMGALAGCWSIRLSYSP